MIQYICLLRGINVGGKNAISMKELKAVFENLGFQQVRTYINSGNVLFQSENSREDELIELCEKANWEAFQLEIALVILTAQELEDALEQAPFWWQEDPNAKHNAIFVIPPMTGKELVAGMGPSKPEFEKVAWNGKVVFWTAPLATFSRTKWSQIVKTPYYQYITIRNANTAKKLLAMAKVKEDK